jgi:putative ABC transport system permease protein
VLAFALGLTLATGVLCGLAPVVQAARRDPGRDLGDMSDRSGGGGTRGRLRQGLVVAEVALALMLLVGAALLLQSFSRLRGVDPGFRAGQVLAAGLDMPRGSYPEGRDWVAFHDRLVAELGSLPGVSASAVALPVPFSGSDIGLGYEVVGQPVDEERRPTTEYFAVSEGWFETMQIAILEGRDVRPGDDPEAPPVVVVSQSFARTHWPGRSALGERVVIGYGDPVEREVVGVVADVRRDGLDAEPGPQLYAPFRQTPWPFVGIALRSSVGPRALEASLRGAVARLDPGLVLYDVRTMEQMLAGSVAGPRFQAVLIGSFAAAALLLAAIGLYGVMAWSVTQRRRELGIRLALGARRDQVLSLVLVEGLRLVGAGIGLGTLGALAATRVLESLLFGIEARDVLTYAGVATLLAVVALAACYLPARRATRTDPAVALHAE